MKENGERSRPETGQRTDLVVGTDLVPTLGDLGVTKDQASRWQRMAEVPDTKRPPGPEMARSRAKGSRS